MAKKLQQYDLPEDNADVQELADSLEALLNSYGDDAKEGFDEARSNAERLLKKTRSTFNEGKKSLRENLCDSGCQATQWVQDNPASALGVTAAVGFVFGLLLSRK
ncbi:DUF883 family protein [Rosenbergiella sp. S61]|uniref:DUF883 family protein n=1 Tax=Rosenbergiella gaditana TaxID=2726987 RepID=A0ABS5SZ65_9GAMM|nr:DUF883 family protein [Rosenbergiella gaditana]MBT0725386.1 DUF883 family protein [Rosenbergiella gaditana]